ncbi:pentapeptide repeat-containing protein [Paracoccus tibetensis]|uniref:Uncharacterized protein YjbI, contains pentapeptide repeats n=1 Tax=Paracoccus tibetensis TaxID=336292 RepID=A0A1G5BB17_9RHOB|nr:pentapeptide repeat-containing protein [Paracoccus tibetensis]SCX87309.1 Uncharacterized protein YjbI, contains pentapeptide repeats [Paracoccus tibetensis]
MNKHSKRAESFTDWLGITNTPDWNVARPLGPLLSAIIGLLFFLALIAAIVLLAKTIFASGTTTLSTGALIAAFLGAPLVIWGTILKQQSVMFQKEGHMTDRISKAVEQLGAEKAVERIGRPVTIWTGQPERVLYHVEAAKQLQDQPRTRMGLKSWREYWNDETEETDEGWYATISTWPEERTLIQWQGEGVEIEENEAIGIEGPWQVFKETSPNIEVRIGAILSLERIAQDSTRHDNGRDHVRVMEILCAYVRHNAPASKATFGMYPEGVDENSLREKIKNPPYKWIMELERPRSDIQLALTVIGRRSLTQIGIEKQHPDGGSIGYRLDLSQSNLRRCDLTRARFAHANLKESLLEGAFCADADFSYCNLINAKLTWISGARAGFSRAKLDSADLSYADLNSSNLAGVRLSHTHLVKTQLKGSSLQFLPNRRGTEVNRAFFMSASLNAATISGDLLGIVLDFGKDNADASQRLVWGLRFRNIRLLRTKSVFGTDHSGMLFPVELLDHTFGDGSVLVPHATCPPHWPRAELTDAEYDSRYLRWLEGDIVGPTPHSSVERGQSQVQ